jgi:hypothetical protein
MDCLSVAASIVAVLDLTVKVASLLFQFSEEVKAAKSDIENLQGELDRLSIILEGGRELLESPNGAKLQPPNTCAPVCMAAPPSYQRSKQS